MASINTNIYLDIIKFQYTHLDLISLSCLKALNWVIYVGYFWLFDIDVF